MVFGNSTVASENVSVRPVFHTNHSKTLETVGDNLFRLKAPLLRATEGETVTLGCPVYGFPTPTVEWFKDDVPVGQYIIAFCFSFCFFLMKPILDPSVHMLVTLCHRTDFSLGG